jgi:hypothetical protein
MSEEVGTTEGTDIGNTEADDDTPDFETTAKEKGWRPKEEYDGDGWVGAEEFVKRQPLFDKIKIQSKKLKELEHTVEAMAKHYSTNIQQAKEKAIADLKAERREAIELGEAVRVDQIDQQIDHVKAMQELNVKPSGPPAEIEQFIAEQKDWFNKDEDMTAFAVAYNESYLKKNPDLGKSLEETLKAVKKAFPEKFENKRRTSAPAVEGAGISDKTPSKYSFSRLNNEQKLVYNQLVKAHKQMTHDEYFKSLEDAGFLDK